MLNLKLFNGKFDFSPGRFVDKETTIFEACGICNSTCGFIEKEFLSSNLKDIFPVESVISKPLLIFSESKESCAF